MSDESGTKQQPEYNWSKTIAYNPTSYVAPMNLMALRQAVQDATQAGQQIRPRGTGHSWNEAISTSGCSINTCNMNPSNSSACVCKGKPPAERPCGRESCNDVVWGDVITVNGQPYQLLTVPPGINQGDLALLAQNKGCPLPTQGRRPTSPSADSWPTAVMARAGWSRRSPS